MFTLLYRLLIVFSLLSCNAAVAAGYDNPFTKNDRINIGKDISWKIDQQAVLATKSTVTIKVFIITWDMIINKLRWP